MIIQNTDALATTTCGVDRFPINGIKVIVVGGGIGGLQAALECWRKGCDVVVLEKAEEASPIGDYFTITPPALVTLNKYPGMYTDYHETVYNALVQIYSPNGKRIKSDLPEWKRPGVTHCAPDVDISFIKRRSVFARMQRDELLRLGIPIHAGQKAVKVHETAERIVVETESGERFEGHVCIAASGVGSSFGRNAISGTPDVQDSGYAVARVAFPRCIIDPKSPAAALLENVDIQPEFRVYLGDDIHLILMLTKDWVAWVFTHKSDDISSESWHDLREADRFISRLEDQCSDSSTTKWDPAVISFLKQTPTKVVDWRLMWRDSMEQWTSDAGRFVRIGDAAHSFLPTSGNGANQALEDAISLAECLRLGGTEGVMWATKIHNKLRFQRTSILQQAGFLNREELHHADLTALQAAPENSNKVGFFKAGRWAWDHDPEKYAQERFDACLAHVRDGKPFENTNLPPGHVYRAWSLKSENERMKAGIPSDLKTNGYWGT